MEIEQSYGELETIWAEKLGDKKVSSMVKKYIQPYKELMSYYRCAMMEMV